LQSEFLIKGPFALLKVEVAEEQNESGARKISLCALADVPKKSALVPLGLNSRWIT
jgi:hypothetical protein